MRNPSSIFSKIREEDFVNLLQRYRALLPVEESRAVADSYALIRGDNHGVPADAENVVRELERRWYASLPAGPPDYGVYSSPYYVCDLWSCWVMYSRKGLLALAHGRSLYSRSVVSFLRPYCSTVLDLGCGFGYTTAGLKELFPEARVIGTNLQGTFQFNMASDLSASHGFELQESFQEKADLVVASEYFEHIERPVEHLFSLVRAVRPSFLVLANGFLGKAIGHFDWYWHLDKRLSARGMSRFFCSALRTLGFEKQPTKVWNNRPSLWVKRS